MADKGTDIYDSDHSHASSILEPHPTIKQHVQAVVRPHILGIFGVVTVFLFMAQFALAGSTFQVDGKTVPHWKVFTVMNMCILMIVTMVLNPPNFPCEMVLILGSTLFAFLGIIEPESLLEGLSDSTVTSVALLFPMAKAVSDTGTLEAFAARVLGTPKSVRSALVRLWLLVGLLSAVVNNTPMIAMMIPVLELWCQRLGFDVTQLALPMAYTSQMGGSLTLMGSPTNFASQGTFAKFGYEFGFFELTVPASILFVFGGIYATLVVPWVLGKPRENEHFSTVTDVVPNTAIPRQEAALVQDVQNQCQNHNFRSASESAPSPVFEIVFQVQSFSIFINTKAEEAGFQRLPGVLRVQNIVRDGMALGQDAISSSLQVAEEGFAEAWRSVMLKGGDQIVFGATAEGIVALRATRGIQLPVEHEVLKLGAKRRQRSLFEVEVSPASDLIGQRVGVHNFRFEHRCALLAVRHRETKNGNMTVGGRAVGVGEGQVTRRGRMSCPNLPMPFVPGTQVPEYTFDGYVLREGDVLLMEASDLEIGSPSWRRDFGLVRQVRNSSPPRVGRIQDTFRSLFAVLGAAFAIGAYVAVGLMDQKKASLSINLVALVGFYLLTKTLTVQQIYASMDVSVLLTIVGAFPFGTAFEAVGFDTWIANGLVKLMQPYGKPGCFLAIYIVSAGLSNLISNIAVIVMIAPICHKISLLNHYPLRAIVILVTISSSAVYTCPIGHQTNLMVRPVGDYAWGDYFKFGFVLQVFHAFMCVALCCSLY